MKIETEAAGIGSRRSATNCQALHDSKSPQFDDSKLRAFAGPILSLLNIRRARRFERRLYFKLLIIVSPVIFIFAPFRAKR
jgi:hypothetical protein